MIAESEWLQSVRQLLPLWCRDSFMMCHLLASLSLQFKSHTLQWLWCLCELQLSTASALWRKSRLNCCLTGEEYSELQRFGHTIYSKAEIYNTASFWGYTRAAGVVKLLWKGCLKGCHLFGWLESAIAKPWKCTCSSTAQILVDLCSILRCEKMKYAARCGERFPEYDLFFQYVLNQ